MAKANRNRNIDKVRAMENQIEHLRGQNAALRQRLMGYGEIQKAADAVMVSVARHCGWKDTDKMGNHTGWSVRVPTPSIKALDTYAVLAEQKDGMLEIRVVRRDGKEIGNGG